MDISRQLITQELTTKTK